MSRTALPATRPAMSAFLQQHLLGDSHTRAYYDAGEKHVVAVVESAGTPSPQLTTYVTSSLHASPNLMDDQDIRVELMMVGPSGTKEVGNIVATSAFFVMKDRWLAAPGVMFPDAVREYFPDTTVPHVIWVEPFDFTGVSRISLDDLSFDVHALQAMPISDRERQLVLDDGYDALTDLLESHSAEHFDLHRASVI